MNKSSTILAKSKKQGGLTLIEHIQHVLKAIDVIAPNFGLNLEIAQKGVVLHDIGKVSPIFQERLREDFRPNLTTQPFRHEIASLFFLSLLEEKIHGPIIEMIIAHHKSILNDANRMGILDLDEDWENVFNLHIRDWEKWSPIALEILEIFGWQVRKIERSEAYSNYKKVLGFCKKTTLGWSEWKGLLIAADHYASALGSKTDKYILKTFKTPKLTYYENRKNSLYPLSLVKSNSDKKHTIVVAPTGAGKTDFLLRRCKGRIFYTLPFQASINAMFKRIASDLEKDNPDLDIRLLHASSRILLNSRSNAIEEKMLQDKVGTSIKILTPHQIASLVFGTRGFEALLMDIKGCDVILDEVHTYSGITKSIVLKIVEVLNHFDCKIHIGTATMPSALYKEIIKLLDPENTYQVSLPSSVLSTFNRHIVHKIKNFDDIFEHINAAIEKKLKILLVCNTVKKAQQIFKSIEEKYPDIKKMLIHSRFKRLDRASLEEKLKNEFDANPGPCLVVSTQVVEVSLDINFDLMVTEAAPLDNLIQRFGRINRKRSLENIGVFKPVYILQPPDNPKDAKPYNLDVVQISYQILPNNDILQENEIQNLLDRVYPEIETKSIAQSSKFNKGMFLLKKLSHEPKSVLLDSLDIDNVSCILQSDVEKYLMLDSDSRISLEIPYRFWSIVNRGLERLDFGSHPFIIPDGAYSPVYGLVPEYLEASKYSIEKQML